MENIRIAIICPIYNARNYVKPFLESFNHQTYNNFEIIVVDDGSIDGSSDFIKEKYPEVILLFGDGNYWWSKSVNKGIKYALKNKFDYVLTINVDLVVENDYLENLIKNIPDDNSIIGSAQYDIKSKKLLSLGGVRNWITAKDKKNIDNLLKDSKILFPVSHFCGRGLLIPIKAFNIVELFDEKNFPQYAADDVFTFMAAKNGFSIFCNKSAKVYLHQGNTGISRFTNKPSLSNMYNYFTNIKSSGNLRIKWKMVKKVVPKKYLITYIVIDTLREFTSYIRLFFR